MSRYGSVVYMNGGSERKGKPHNVSKAKSTWRYECMQFVLWALTQMLFV